MNLSQVELSESEEIEYDLTNAGFEGSLVFYEDSVYLTTDSVLLPIDRVVFKNYSKVDSITISHETNSIILSPETIIAIQDLL